MAPEKGSLNGHRSGVREGSRRTWPREHLNGEPAVVEAELSAAIFAYTSTLCGGIPSQRERWRLRSTPGIWLVKPLPGERASERTLFRRRRRCARKGARI